MESKSPVPDGGGGGGNGLPPKPSRRDGAAPPESDMSHMLESPRRAVGHRRAHSETIGGLPDDLDLGVPGGGGGGEGRASLSDENEEELFSMFLDAEKLNASEAESSSCAPAGVGARPRHHQHSHSMDASSSFDAEQLLGAAPAAEGMSTAEAKKAMSNAKLAELALVDPKKAKRIWVNRQSAARSKERKMRYISELERKVQTLHTEATTLSTQLALLHRDTAGLSTENSELKMRLQNVEQQVHLQDALNDALKSELQRLRMATGQMGSNVGGMMNFMGPPPPQPFRGNQTMFHIQSQTAMQPLHHMQIHPHHQQQQQQALLHPLQLQAQQLLLGQHAVAPPNPKMKRTISAPNQWVGGWSESSSN